MTAQSDLSVAKVRSSFNRCCCQDNFIPAFFDRLIATVPQAAERFAETDSATLGTLLHAGIVHLIDFADGVVGIESKIRELGIKHDHKHYNVPPELYGYWIEALVQTASRFDPQFNEALGAAWKDVLQPGTKLMASVYSV